MKASKRINKGRNARKLLKKINVRHGTGGCRMEPCESRRYMAADMESVTGAGNNVSHPSWGSAGTDLIRLAAAGYADGVGTPALAGDISARAISNILNSQAYSNNPTEDVATIDGNSLSDFGYSFGQFMDHDMDLTPDGGASFPIAVAADDPIGPSALPFTRSATDPATGTGVNNPLEQITIVTSYLDLSQVYGSNQVVSDALRTFSNGKMKSSPGNMLPYDNSTYFTPEQIAALSMANDAQAAPTSALFATGDRRGNENVELTSLQTLFMRNHNRIAGIVQKLHPKWTGEQIYQEARKLNIAQYQNIVFNGWIPAVLGASALPGYTGYNPNVDATISNEFSTVGFRFGHSLLSAEIERSNNDGREMADVNPAGSTIALAQDFFDPYLLNPTGAVDPLTGHSSSDIGALLKAQADGVSQANDQMAVGDVRNLLFGNGGLGGEDLMARDVQRDRDNGIADYNSLRVAMGLPAVTSFGQITSNVTTQQELAAAYPGGVNTIDAFEGGLAEDHVRGSDVGPLFQAILVDQFTRLRDGDRFFYRNENFSSQELGIIQRGNTLAKIIKANTPITNLQSNVFVFKASISGTVNVAGNSRGNSRFGRGSSVSGSGYTIELEDEDGDVVATTTTDGRGRYSFNQFSGPASDPTVGYGVSATGTYQVVLVLPSGMRLASATPAAITISSGDVNIRGINFGLAEMQPAHHGWRRLLDGEFV